MCLGKLEYFYIRRGLLRKKGGILSLFFSELELKYGEFLRASSKKHVLHCKKEKEEEKEKETKN